MTQPSVAELEATVAELLAMNGGDLWVAAQQVNIFRMLAAANQQMVFEDLGLIKLSYDEILEVEEWQTARAQTNLWNNVGWEISRELGMYPSWENLAHRKYQGLLESWPCWEVAS